LFSIYQSIFSLSFIEETDFEKWSEDIKLYSVYDKDTNNLMGQFYLDLYPREGKYPHVHPILTIRLEYTLYNEVI
jgi:Zn-dependent oligopeptidase